MFFNCLFFPGEFKVKVKLFIRNKKLRKKKMDRHGSELKLVFWNSEVLNEMGH